MSVADRPQVDAALAARLAAERYDLRARATPLASERDRTFRLDGVDGRWVFKVAHAAERRQDLELQHAALARLAEGADADLFPRPLLDRDGAPLTVVTAADGRRHLAQLLTWLPGRLYADADPTGPDGLAAIGRAIGAMDRTLAELDHPAADRSLLWDARRAPTTVRRHLVDLATPERRDLVERTLAAVEAALAPLEPRLRRTVVHNDVNTRNLLIDDDGHPTGIIDFGDLLRSWTAADLAHAATYLMMEHTGADPWPTLDHLRRGYEGSYPLRDEERAALPWLIRLRLCLSVTLSAHQAKLVPNDPYLTVSERPAWGLLERIEEEVG